MLTVQQVRWAASHDWFIRDNGDGTILVRDAYTHNGTYYSSLINWTLTVPALRNWAGY